MSILVHPSYFANVATWVAMVQAKGLFFEIHDNYQKQTYRNRAYIYGANGRLALNVPVHFSQKKRQLYAEVKIANDEKWQSTHWKSLESAYKTSPYFEFYQDDIRPIFEEKHEYIMSLNTKCFEILLECLQVQIPYQPSKDFEKETSHDDYRPLINARKELELPLEPYTQVFSSKHGFLSNLSILDLLFNEGPNSLNYLESQSLQGIKEVLP